MNTLVDRANDLIDACGYDPFSILECMEGLLEEGEIKLVNLLVFWVTGYIKGEFDVVFRGIDVPGDHVELIELANKILATVEEMNEQTA